MNENINTASPNSAKLNFGHLTIHRGGEIVAEWQNGTIEVNMSNQAHEREIANAPAICMAVREAIVGGLIEVGDHFFAKEAKQREERKAEEKAEREAEAESKIAYNKWVKEENEARLKDWEEELKEWKRELAAFKEEEALWLQSDPEERGMRPTFFKNRPSRPMLETPKF